jgi:hypothetical protein
MTDYLTIQYNATMAAVQDDEAKALGGALQAYLNATHEITEKAILKRVEAGAADAAARAVRDHAYHNGPPAPEKPAGLPAKTLATPPEQGPSDTTLTDDRFDPNADTN